VSEIIVWLHEQNILYSDKTLKQQLNKLILTHKPTYEYSPQTRYVQAMEKMFFINPFITLTGVP
jgi:hypothetical protein